MKWKKISMCTSKIKGNAVEYQVFFSVRLLIKVCGLWFSKTKQDGRETVKLPCHVTCTSMFCIVEPAFRHLHEQKHTHVAVFYSLQFNNS